MRQTFFEQAKSIAGATLVAVGMFILYQHLDRAAMQLSRFPGMPCAALGTVPAAIFAASRCVQAYAAGHQSLLRYLAVQMLLSFWPLVLVAVGTVMSREGVTGDASRKSL